ncbi:MAG: hypothetical protein WC538_13910 [Thermoanaerobaculia bacterium]
MTFGSQFLRYPDLFPARIGGEVWGEREVWIDLPGGPYAFTGLSERQELAMRARYGDYLREPAPDFVATRVFRAQQSDFLEVDTRGWEYSLDVEHEAGAILIAGMNLMARLELQARQAGAVWTSEDREEYVIGVVENFFRPLLAYRVAERGALVLHSSAVVLDGGAYVFVGRSGAGKSTVARLALERGHAILSDDLNVLSPAGSGWNVARLPFAGEYPDHGRGETVPVAAIYELEKGATHALSPTTPAASFAALLRCAPYVNGDPYRVSRLEESISAVVRDVPCSRLTFSLDPGFWPIIEERAILR